MLVVFTEVCGLLIQVYAVEVVMVMSMFMLIPSLCWNGACAYHGIFMAYHGSSRFYITLNMTIIQLEHVVDRVMVPPNQASQCNHICLYGKALIWYVVMPLTGASNEGRLCTGTTLAG